MAAVIGTLAVMGILSACAASAPVGEEIQSPQITVTTESTMERTTDGAELLTAAAGSTVEETAEVNTEEAGKEAAGETTVSTGVRLPVGHRIIYSDGEIYGWTRYEYDDQGRKSMIIFVTPTGEEYWSPVYYDGNGHVIPETVGDWSTLDENGLYLEVGTEDTRKRRTPTAEYAYDEKGNLTDYLYMFVSGRYQRHVVYRYDSQNRLVREELRHGRTDKVLHYIEYFYDGQGQLMRMNEVEEGRSASNIQYTLYLYDEDGRLTREERIWGGRVHDYVDYTYNQDGELTTEYHYLEEPMMGGPFTVEYIFEEVVNEEAN